MNTAMLAPDPRSVGEARRWVGEACREIGREDLLECARLAVSELVTNALLHAEPPIEISRGGTAGRPYFKVSDGSVRPPRPVPIPDDESDLLSTVGRGLALVATCSEAWGAQIHSDGKVVWCLPRSEPAEDGNPDAMVLEYADPPRGSRPPTPAATIPVRLCGLPVEHYRAFHHHQRALAREVRLIALTDPGADPVLHEAASSFTDWNTVNVGGLEGLAAALAGGTATVDVTLSIDEASLAVLRDVQAALESIDALLDGVAGTTPLLVEPTDAVGRRFRSWYLGEFAAQYEGRPPHAWSESDG